jgi:hypothetical protein
MAFDKASKTSVLTKQVSILGDEVSSLTAKILHHEECNSFVLGIIESACEMLRCKFPLDLSFSLLLHCYFYDTFALIGTCLDFAAEDRRVNERSAALKKCLQVLKIYGLILDAGVLLFCFRTVPSTLARQWMAAGELS